MKKSEIKSFIGRIVLYFIAAIIFGVSIYNWNAVKLTGNKLPMPFGIGASVVLSGSMEPRLSIDDLVIIKESNGVALYDIVVFQTGNSLVIHRVMEINGDEIITKGDANNACDASITLKDIKGELWFEIPKAGGALEFLQNPIVAIGILVAVLLFSELSYKKANRKDDEEISEILKEIERLTEKK